MPFSSNCHACAFGFCSAVQDANEEEGSEGEVDEAVDAELQDKNRSPREDTMGSEYGSPGDKGPCGCRWGKRKGRCWCTSTK